MNKKTILAFILGAAAGGLAAAKVLEHRYNKIIEDELESLQEWRDRIMNAETLGEDEEVVVETDIIVDAKEPIIYKDTPKNERIDYTKPTPEELVDSYKRLVPFEDDEEEIVNYGPEDDEEALDMDTAIYTISDLDFNTGAPDHDKITITYYEGDDTLADEREEIIPDINYTVGEDTLSKFGYLEHDPDVIYVRNNRISVDFEIIRDYGSYEETVMGVTAPYIPKDQRLG